MFPQMSSKNVRYRAARKLFYPEQSMIDYQIIYLLLLIVCHFKVVNLFEVPSFDDYIHSIGCQQSCEGLHDEISHQFQFQAAFPMSADPESQSFVLRCRSQALSIESYDLFGIMRESEIKTANIYICLLNCFHKASTTKLSSY